jgi:hypothetical protein
MRGRSWVWEVAEEDIHGRARAKEPRDPSSKQVVTSNYLSLYTATLLPSLAASGCKLFSLLKHAYKQEI